MKWKKSLLAVSAAAVVVAGVSGVSAYAHGGDPAANQDREPADAEVFEALQRDLGLSEAEAKQLGKRQAEALELDQELQGKLGASFAGSAFDAETGKLTVKVTEKSAAKQAREAGAKAQVVDHSLRELRKVQRDLDRNSGRTGERSRMIAAQRSSTALQSWHVDEATNTVLVEAKPGKLKQARKAVRKYGDAVSLAEAAVGVRTHDKYWDGGDSFNGCSVGFNVRNNSTGAKYFITAGHCGSKYNSVYGHDSTYFGYFLETWFKSGIDDAIVKANNSTWYQGPWVDYNPSHGSVISINGYGRAPVGAVVCKSGKTTKWTCGKILAHNVTVNYVSGDTVYGLNKSDNCSQPGDSGGSWVNYSYGWKADGVTSGGSIAPCSDSGFRSYYAPMKTAMDYYGPKYGVSMW